MMEKDKYIEIAGKVADGTASEQEIALYNGYYNAYQLKYPSWAELNEQQRKEMLNETQEEIYNQLHDYARKSQIKLWPRIAVAAAAVAAIVFGVFFFKTPHHLEGSAATRDLLTNANDIAPGSNKATLSVNGKTIQLSEDKTGVIVGNDLKYNDGTALGSFANNEGAIKNITASTPRGGMYQITLPDGSRAWMNADTKISFPSQFIGKERKILLSGEAYFEVAKNKDKPFIVESAGQQVEVLGTHFNISAYKGEGIKTTLLEGSVKVMQRNSGLALPGTTLPNSNSIVLKPNQQSVITPAGNITVTQVDPNLAIAWKNGRFSFQNEPLESIMEKVARWYNITVVYENQALRSIPFGGTVSRFTNVSSVLKKLEMTNEVHFSIEGRTVYVQK